MNDDVPAWAVQAACETMGYRDLSEVPISDYDKVYDLAEDLS